MEFSDNNWKNDPKFDSLRVLVIGKSEDKEVQFSIVPYRHKLAFQWVQELLHLQNENVRVLERNRIYSLNDKWNNDKIFQEIEHCYRVINQWRPIFEDIEFVGPSQALMNRLHFQFEKMIGLDKKRSQIFAEAPNEVKNAIKNFNVLIHRHECFMRNSQNKDYGRIVVTFEQKNRRKIEDDDFERFTHKYLPGDVVLNYCHVGKPLLDVILDEDVHVSPENILPQSEWCGDFMIFFNRGPLFREDVQEKVEMFWQKNEKRMNQLGFYKGDSKLAFGSIPVGRLEESPRDLKKRIFGITEICSVKVCQADYGEIEYDFFQN